MDFPTQNITPHSIHTFTKYSGGREIRGMAGGNLTWVANLAIYVPISVPFPYEVRRMFWGNGSTASGNVDVGIYTFGGTQMYHQGSTAQSGTSQLQYVDPTDFILSPGKYYLGVVCSAATANLMYGSSSVGAAPLAMGGVLQEALGSTALPATMTPVEIANSLYPLIGLTRTPSGF